MASRDTIKAAFGHFDPDRSGKLSVEEMVALLTRPGTGFALTNEDVLVFFREVGVVADG